MFRTLILLGSVVYSQTLTLSQNSSDIPANSLKSDLLTSIASVPPNAPTSREQTNYILSLVRELEQCCPTDDQDVLQELAGNWQLLWTAQDSVLDSKDGVLSILSRPLRSFINPLENQAYSNNPVGRANPFLPRDIQDRLEDLGIMSSDSIDGFSPAISTQAIDIRKQRVRNVVAFRLGKKLPLLATLNKSNNAIRGSITVDVSFKPNKGDARKVDVKFERCKFSVKDILPKPIDFPLGPIGPTGWLRTGYIDDKIRITRGHKGSVFVLLRASLIRS